MNDLDFPLLTPTPRAAAITAHDHDEGRELAGLSVAYETELVSATADGCDDRELQPIADMLEKVRALLDMDVAFVGAFSNGDRIFTHLAAKHPPLPVQPGLAIPLEETYCQRVIDGRLPAIIPDSSLIPEAAALPATQAFGIGAYLTAPVVLSDGTVYGTVCCVSHAPMPSMGEAEQRTLQTVADLVSASLGRADAIESIVV